MKTVNMVTTLAAAAFALAAFDAVAFPLGAAGLLIPQFSITVAVPVLPAAIVVGVAAGLAAYGGYELYKKAAGK